VVINIQKMLKESSYHYGIGSGKGSTSLVRQQSENVQLTDLGLNNLKAVSAEICALRVLLL